MSFKVIFVLATACVITNASVLTINVYNDDPETKFASNPKVCNPQACDQLCRRLKFTGGACVNGRCKCDNFLNAEDTMTDLAEVLSLRSCYSIECDDQCRREGWDRGACIKGECKCNYFLNTDTMTDLAGVLSPRSCNSIECDDQCRREGWDRGACINGQCKCNYFLNTAEELLEDQAERGCNQQACDQLCHRLKFTGGVCVNGRCKCDNFLGTEDASPDYKVTRVKNEEPNEILRTIKEKPNKPAPSSCNASTCYSYCRLIKFAGGWCRFGFCQCF